MSVLSDVLRIYAPDECGADGYPLAWHRLPHDWLLDWSSGIGESHYPPGERLGVKDVIRAEVGHRCERCGHPFRVGAGGGEWSRCDERCTHRGPYRYRHGDEDEWLYTPEDELWIGEAGLGDQVGIEVHARWRILTVHHLNGVKHDLRWWNLAALCQRCHLQIQGRVQMERVWPWEHSEWFRAHAAGWYAFAYLDEDITREQAIERMDELLALERVA